MKGFLKITKDTKNDVAYIQFRKGRVQKSIELSPGLIFDYDKAGEIIGIEILSLKKLAPLLGKPKKGQPQEDQPKQLLWHPILQE